MQRPSIKANDVATDHMNIGLHTGLSLRLTSASKTVPYLFYDTRSPLIKTVVHDGVYDFWQFSM